MNPEQSKKLVKQTFQADFDRQRFVEFIDRLLKRVDFEKQFIQSGFNIRRAFLDKVGSFERVGQYADGDGKTIDILIVNLKKDVTLERGRTGLRNFAADYLQSDRGLGKSAVLVAYVSSSQTDWRFSYVTLEKDLKQTDKGTFKEEITSLTPARRYSFLVGRYENSHTAQKQFFDLLNNDEPKLQHIEEAFNIEKVTKEFFGQYKELFESVRNELDKICRKSETIREEFINKGMFAFAKDSDGNEKLDRNGNKVKEPYTDDFAKKLLGQIVFLYFLQKKGWFGVGRDDTWGTGDKHFLRSLFQNKQSDENFFDSILEPLFYDTLAAKRQDDWSPLFNSKIPFLNGGLFEPLNNYDWIHTDIHLSDKLFSNSELTKDDDNGSGILDVFDRYNFTINEAEPLEVEVAVDPEMLGKIFENLLPENIRHGSGTYYTPRVIVAYMCQQSLINHLASHLPDISRDDIENFIRFGSQQRDYTEAGTQSQAKNFLPQSIVESAVDVDKLLASITVCDPAIGSGAFPVGMMLEIVKAREALQSVEGIGQQSQYDLKRQTIENSLYGVDIDSGAVEIAKLRLWLSLIVDEAEFQKIEPLPNLDYKIMQGNSLLDEFHGIKLIDEKLFEYKRTDKEAQLKEIDAQIAQLQTELGKANVGRQSSLFELTRRAIAELTTKRQMVNDGQIDLRQKDLFAPVDESHQKLEDLKNKHKEIFNETRKEVKERLRDEAEKLEWQFIAAKLKADGKTDELAELEGHRNDRRKNYFLWQLNFPEIFESGGFDVVIGNPPYVRQEEIKDLKPALQRSYQTYAGTADLLVYFYERSWQVLKSNGNQSFITSNKFFRAAYGEKLRKFLAENTRVKQIIDFGDAPVFEAISYPCILIWQKVLSENRRANEHNEVRVLSWASGEAIETFEHIFSERGFLLAQAELKADSWLLESPKVFRLLKKLQSNGTPLGEYVNGKFFYGIKTGLNEAFVVDGVTRNNLIAEDANSAKLLKPFLRGRDIKRWQVNFAHFYLIKIESSENKTHPWSGNNSNKAESIFSSTFPAVYKHLQQFRRRLIDRADQGTYFWELRSCAYWDEFNTPKIILGRFMNSPMYAFDREKFLHNDALYVIPRVSEFLASILNSKVSWWFLTKICTDLQNGYLQALRQNQFQIPIPKAAETEKAAIEKLVTQVLETRQGNPSADTSSIENAIDEKIYELYGLTDEEIAIVEGRV